MNSTNKYSIVFFGNDWRSAIVLKKLIETPNIKVNLLVTLPDRPQGRDKKIIPNPAGKLAQKQDIPIVELEKLKKGSTKPVIPNLIRDLYKQGNNSIDSGSKSGMTEVGVLASFGAKIPPETIKFFPKGILALHPSLLPKYRGTKPAAWAILNGEKNTGVTIIKINKKFDQGPIVAQFKEKILPTDTTQSLEKRLFEAAAQVIATILPAYIEGRIQLREQDQSESTYIRKLKKSDGRIDWSRQDPEIERLIRAMTPWPGAWTKVNIKDKNKRLKILKAHLENGGLVLDQVQLAGKNPVSWEQFQQGYPEAEITKKE